ncbi:TspO/MBR family protein [Ferrovibrio sp.]|uniref:TspO/MBR family protein n=1 Tax=Ferrovibrio sp. TaxID=1917215 RepID=UPI0035B1AE6E
MPRPIPLIAFILLVVGGGLLIGSQTLPGPWYAELQKPVFNPPNWLFGPVWTLLYLLIAIAGWQCWRYIRSSLAMRLWWLQLALNFIWSPVFFGMQSIGGALIIVLLLLLAVAAFIMAAWRPHRPAALLFLPYLAWVAFAALLNGSLFLLNP